MARISVTNRIRWGNAVDKVSDGVNLIAGILMLGVSIIICYETVSRHFFDRPTSWVMSMSLLGFMWFPFLSSPYGIQTDKHVTCDVFVSRLSGPVRQYLGVATDITTMMYFVGLGWFGYLMFAESYQFKSMSAGLVRYPMWILHMSFPLGMFLCQLQTVRKVMARIQWLRRHSPSANFGRRRPGKKPILVVLLYLLNFALAVLVFKLHQPFGILITALVLLFWGVPIAFALGVVGLVGLLYFHGSISGLYTLPIVAEKTVHNFVLLAIPLFSLGGVILSRSGLGEQMYDLSSKWFGWLPGGLGVATCVTGGVLAAMIGSSTAVTAIVTLVAMQPLLDRGYNKKLVVGTVTGSSLGLIIPPSIGFIVYGFLTETSVGRLFIAGFVPGMMLVVMFSVYVIANCLITGHYETTRYSWRSRFATLHKAIVILAGPAFVLGSIYSGLATPTEAGAILVIYSLICTFFYKQMDLEKFILCLKESSVLSTMILMIMVGALTMSNVITLLKVPSDLTEAIVSSGLPNTVVLSILVLFYLVLGMFLDGGSITVLTVPVIAPMLPALGIDTVVFGVILMMLIETALLTPPVGLNLFTVKGIVDEPLSFIINSVLPFVLILIIGVILVFAFPELALWLPSQMR
jgi:tripartite ATP-independent transporter DctM subunit